MIYKNVTKQDRNDLEFAISCFKEPALLLIILQRVSFLDSTLMFAVSPMFKLLAEICQSYLMLKYVIAPGSALWSTWEELTTAGLVRWHHLKGQVQQRMIHAEWFKEYSTNYNGKITWCWRWRWRWRWFGWMRRWALAYSIVSTLLIKFSFLYSLWV